MEINKYIYNYILKEEREREREIGQRKIRDHDKK
jgi:hypothetical protein